MKLQEENEGEAKIRMEENKIRKMNLLPDTIPCHVFYFEPRPKKNENREIEIEEEN